MAYDSSPLPWHPIHLRNGILSLAILSPSNIRGFLPKAGSQSIPNYSMPALICLGRMPETAGSKGEETCLASKVFQFLFLSFVNVLTIFYPLVRKRKRRGQKRENRYWDVAENRRQFLSDIAAMYEFDPLDAEGWKRLSYTKICENKVLLKPSLLRQPNENIRERVCLHATRVI